jgi:hypothetical protein
MIIIIIIIKTKQSTHNTSLGFGKHNDKLACITPHMAYYFIAWVCLNLVVDSHVP